MSSHARLSKNRLNIFRILARAAAAGRYLSTGEVAAAAGITYASASNCLLRACKQGMVKCVDHMYAPPWQMSEETAARQGAENFELGPVRTRRRVDKKLLAQALAMRYAGRPVKEVAKALNVSEWWVTHRASLRRIKRERLLLFCVSQIGDGRQQGKGSMWTTGTRKGL